MQPLTHQVWERHHVQLRPYVVEEFPEVDRRDVESVGNDFAGLVEVLQRATNWSAELVHAHLRKLDVEEMNLGTGTREREVDTGRASLEQLRLGDGFSEAERDRVVARLAKLNRRLRKFPAEGTELHLTAKERDTPSQKMTLECWLPKFGKIVATSQESDLKAALMEVREDLWRQIDDAVNRRKEGTG